LSEPPGAEIVRAAWAACGRRDTAGFLSYTDENVEAVPFGAAMEGRVYHGHAGVREWLEREIYETYDAFETIPEVFQEVGDHLLVFGRWCARGKESATNIEFAATWVVDVRDRKIVRWQTYTDRDEAIRDARRGQIL
jgi:ketosteroid isomerase-like protein